LAGAAATGAKSLNTAAAGVKRISSRNRGKAIRTRSSSRGEGHQQQEQQQR
jgi:hypothetical protein